MAKKLKIYNGSSWEDVTFAITPPSTNVTNSFSTNQVIDTSTSVAALRITQRGTGEALRVEDETNPDSTPFVITSAGNVGIGVSSPSGVLDINGRQNIRGNAVLSFQNTGNTAGFDVGLLGGTSDPIGYIFNRANSDIAFGTNNAETMRLTASGNLGISVSNPTYRIQTFNSLAAGVGSQSLIFQTQVNNGNNDYLKLYQERTAAAASWDGSDWILRRQVDNTPMGGFRWGGSRWNVTALYGIPTDASVRTSHISTSAPTGGIDGDIWLVYTA
jgi:hypothetical protein